jgi:hypothetical protein
LRQGLDPACYSLFNAKPSLPSWSFHQPAQAMPAAHEVVLTSASNKSINQIVDHFKLFFIV